MAQKRWPGKQPGKAWLSPRLRWPRNHCTNCQGTGKICPCPAPSPMANIICRRQATFAGSWQPLPRADNLCRLVSAAAGGLFLLSILTFEITNSCVAPEFVLHRNGLFGMFTVAAGVFSNIGPQAVPNKPNCRLTSFAEGCPPQPRVETSFAGGQATGQGQPSTKSHGQGPAPGGLPKRQVTRRLVRQVGLLNRVPSDL